ncbi:LPXTG cell wall anchor domain-containing protein [Kitasatospora sp. NPDC059646]|uniref:LPXTG cell wall anchor domain-containing protein n=1 Tax=Kitasatospora sp. NPDC059646 TaxID=3346893 RepID=UPI00367CDD73
MRFSRSRSLGLASALAVLTLGSAAAIPAHAADAVLKIEAPDAVAVDPSSTAPDHGSGSTAVRLGLTFSNHPTPANGRVTVDLAPLQGIASVMPQSGCAVVGQVLTCDMQTMYNGKLDLSFYLYGPAAAREAGATAVLHTTAVFDGRTAGADTKVTLGGSNVTMKDVDTNHGLKPGDTWTPDLAVTNKGQLPASQLYFTFTGGMDLSFVPRFSNCEYGTSADGDAVICTVHSELAAGETVRLDPIGFKVDSTAYYAYEDVRVTTAAPAKDGWLGHFAFTPGPAGGPALTVGKPERQGAPNGVIDFDRNNTTALAATVPNTADFAVEGGWSPDSGRLGELTVGIADNGPGSIFWRSGSYPAIVRVTVPKEVKILRGSQPKCQPSLRNQDPKVNVWDCTTTSYIKNGYRDWFYFDLDLDHSAGLSATVTMPSIGEDGQDGGMPWDPNKNNNTVVIPLGTASNTTRPTVPGGSPTPSTPAPGSSAPGSPTASPSTSPSGGASTGATPGPSSTGAVGGSLASTGADGIGTTVAAGSAAIVLGGGLVLANRRRKRGAHE